MPLFISLNEPNIIHFRMQIFLQVMFRNLLTVLSTVVARVGKQSKMTTIMAYYSKNIWIK